MGFSFGDFLEQSQEVDICEKKASGEGGERDRGKSAGGREAELVNFGARRWGWRSWRCGAGSR